MRPTPQPRCRRLLPLALGLTALAAAATVGDAFVAPLGPHVGQCTSGGSSSHCSSSSSSSSHCSTGSSSRRHYHRPSVLQQQPPPPPASSSSSSSSTSSSTRLWARRRRKGDDADFERFNLDELRDESRFAPVEEMDPEMFRPSKMEYYVPPPTDEMEEWDVTDTRCVVALFFLSVLGRAVAWVGLGWVGLGGLARLALHDTTYPPPPYLSLTTTNHSPIPSSSFIYVPSHHHHHHRQITTTTTTTFIN
jgi:hypothetical protein